MQYLSHDFFSNFEGGVNSGDVEFTIDLWVNELSDILVSKPQKIVDLLNKVGVSAKITETDEELIARKTTENFYNVFGLKSC